MATPNFIPHQKVPVNLEQKIPIEKLIPREEIEKLKLIASSGANSINNNGFETDANLLFDPVSKMPKQYLESGDILSFNYASRTKYKIASPEEKMNTLNPIVICCGFDRGRLHGIDLRVLSMKDKSGDTNTVLYRNYKQVYHDFDGKRRQVNFTDKNSFNPITINSGNYGKELYAFYRSYNFSNIKKESAKIINIYQAEILSGMGHIISP